uniref:Uncharacterized protein n=1 Tax=Brassica oleracea TaxID=3712 RepID=A0A3P6EFT1_BRAOL|nr:unnamed protein product [Brassica oleracea]
MGDVMFVFCNCSPLRLFFVKDQSILGWHFYGDDCLLFLVATPYCGIQFFVGLCCNSGCIVAISPHSWQLRKKCDSSCFLTLNRSSLGCDSLVFSVMEPTYLQNLSLGLGDSFAGSIVSSMEVFRFIMCLTLLVALVVIISMGISKPVYKVDYQELTNLLSESWSFDVHRILLAIRSLIFSFVALYAHFSCCCAYAMANSLACDAFLCCNTSSSNGVLNVLS